ncbi:tyrosine-type recombinase/integrase [Vallitalea guaymasensis]|uniref:tyrosine-type recombinase/integrase n=1 Tax=Vallitalea guaymasensis TaxID=1185412 RepID=UPI00235736FC|nr:tyrosine-type recombinase/integrase [Vallitalea guaymasensis]
MAKRRGNGEGTITKRSDGRYMGQISFKDPVTGKTKRKTVYGKTQKEAMEKLNKIKYEIQTGVFNVSDNITFEAWALTWLKEYKKNSLKKGTYTMYCANFNNHVFHYIGKVKLKDLQPHHLQSLYNRLLDNGRKGSSRSNQTGLSPTTIKRIHIPIGSCLKQAVRNGLINRNVGFVVEVPKQIKHEINPLTKEEIQQFLEYAKLDRLYGAFLLECGTGLRRGELAALKWKNIDFDNSTLQVKQSLVVRYDMNATEEGRKATTLEFDSPKTEKSKRTIPIPQPIMVELRKHKARQSEEKLRVGKYYNDNDLVFCNIDGSPLHPATITTKFKSILKKAGLKDARFHDLRHSFATLLLEMNEHPKVVQELLGHSSITTTLDIYSHVSLDKKEEAVQKLNTVFK